MPAKIVIGNVHSRIFGLVPEELEKQINEELSYTVQNYQHIAKNIASRGIMSSDWDCTVNLYWPRKGHLFYTGMMSDVLSILDKANYEYTIDDRREIPDRNLDPTMDFVLPPNKFERPYQNIVVASMVKATRGVLQAATGSGKTFMMTKLIGLIKSGPFLFFVPSIDLMDQAHSCLSDCLTVPIGRVGDGECDIQQINVVMIQTAVKALKRNDPTFKFSDYRFDEEDEWDTTPIDEPRAVAIDKLIRSAAGVYMDEVHHAASKTCQTIMEACTSAYWRFGGSATPFREDGAEKMIKALFGRVVQRISASWLIRNKYLVKPYIFNIRLDGLHGIWKSYPEVYKNYIVENDDLNHLIARLSLRMKQLDVPNLILVQQYAHGDLIRKMVPDAPFIKGNMPKKKRKTTIESLRNGTIQCAIATTLADEGLDIERLGCVMVGGGGKSCTRVYQRVGRVLRTFEDKTTGFVKERAVVFLFHHDAPFLEAHGKKVARILAEEPEFVIINSDEKRIIDDVNDVLCPGSAGIFG